MRGRGDTGPPWWWGVVVGFNHQTGLCSGCSFPPDPKKTSPAPLAAPTTPTTVPRGVKRGFPPHPHPPRRFPRRPGGGNAGSAAAAGRGGERKGRLSRAGPAGKGCVSPREGVCGGGAASQDLSGMLPVSLPGPRETLVWDLPPGKGELGGGGGGGTSLKRIKPFPTKRLRPASPPEQGGWMKGFVLPVTRFWE